MGLVASLACPLRLPASEQIASLDVSSAVRAGIMQGVMAFTQAQALPGGECIKDGVDMLKASMAGTFPTDAQLAEINAKLA